MNDHVSFNATATCFVSVFAYVHVSMSSSVGCVYMLQRSAGGLDQYPEQHWASDSACTVWAWIQSGPGCDVTVTELCVL